MQSLHTSCHALARSWPTQSLHGAHVHVLQYAHNMAHRFLRQLKQTSPSAGKQQGQMDQFRINYAILMGGIVSNTGHGPG